VISGVGLGGGDGAEMTCCRQLTWDLLSSVLESRLGAYWILAP
jgi:hypothetical protein